MGHGRAVGEPLAGETVLETFHWFRGEGFGLIVEDLLRLQAEPGVIAEGFRLLPRLVQPLLAGARPGGPSGCCPRPASGGPPSTAAAPRGRSRADGGSDRVLRNLLERDRMFTERLSREARQLGLPVIEVDTAVTGGGSAGAGWREAFGLGEGA